MQLRPTWGKSDVFGTGNKVYFAKITACLRKGKGAALSSGRIQAGPVVVGVNGLSFASSITSRPGTWVSFLT